MLDESVKVILSSVVILGDPTDLRSINPCRKFLSLESPGSKIIVHTP